MVMHTITYKFLTYWADPKEAFNENRPALEHDAKTQTAKQ